MHIFAITKIALLVIETKVCDQERRLMDHVKERDREWKEVESFGKGRSSRSSSRKERSRSS